LFYLKKETMKKIAIMLTVALGAVLYSFNPAAAIAQNSSNSTSMKTVYDYDYIATSIDGQQYRLGQLKGKKIMIVNVASHCGYTPQYAELQELYEKYRAKGFVILGFPCNQFAGQEPGDESEIKSFCEKNYGVTFPLFAKVDVKGKDQHPLYKWLTSKELNGVEDSEVSWNFNKYLIDENGYYVAHLKSGVSPMDAQVINWLEGK